MTSELRITREGVSLAALQQLLKSRRQISLAEDTVSDVTQSRAYLQEKLKDPEALFYGISTGFGSQYQVRISSRQMRELQNNLIGSHTAGAGRTIPREVSRIILLLKLISLSRGYSGVRLELINRLIEFYNRDLIPVIYEFGSLGASGDLAPLAHMSLTLLGKGEFYSENGISSAGETLQSQGLEPLQLYPKEGLALINGTQFSTGFGVWAYFETQKLLKWADIVTVLSIEAFDCNLSPFDARIHEIRPHAGQGAVARHIRNLLESSGVASRPAKHLQDPYAFRCVPQVHGASYDVNAHIGSVLETELNSVTDNPLIFHNSDAILSGGNFHAHPVALALDYLSIAVSEIGNISERRTYQLLSGTRGLPSCLIENAGLQSGLMIAQYTAASIVNRNKILCTPASADSIPSSMGQEDHVSMAANAATKLHEIINNCKSILGIELLCACQGIELKHYQAGLSEPLRLLFDDYRQSVPYLAKDDILHNLMESSRAFIETRDPSELLG